MALNDLKLTFHDEFNNLSLDTGTPATEANLWNTSMYNGWVRTLSGNDEEQWYMDADYKGLGVNPFSVDNGILKIHAAPASAAVQAATGHGYTSGVLTTQGAFSQTYGYFETRAKVPAGQGLWSGFWLLADNDRWPPELDVLETVGNQMNYAHQTVHTALGPVQGKATWSDAKLSDGYHTYGMDWTQSNITFYLDGKATWSMATPGDMHSPMYVLLNLAVGGTWPGSPDSTTNWASANYNVDYVRVYQHSGMAESGTPLPSGSAPTKPPASSSGLNVSNVQDSTSTAGAKFAAPDTGASTSRTYSASELGLPNLPSTAKMTVSFDAEKNMTATNDGAWNGIKNVAFSGATDVTLKNFVDVRVTLNGDQPHSVNVTGAKRGTITTGGGNDTVDIAGTSNGTTGNLMTVSTGNGADNLRYTGSVNNRIAVETGAGNDAISLSGQSKGMIDAGSGDDRINIASTGNPTITGGDGHDVFSFVAGAHATITDFTAGQDRVELQGLGADNLRVRNDGTSTLIDLNGKNAATLSGVALNANQLNLSYV